jgi:hypothetical protein
MSACLILEHSTQQQDDLGRRQLAAFEDCPTVQGIDAPAHPTTIHRQAAAAIGTKDSRVGESGLTMRITKAIQMEMLLAPHNAGVGIE